MGNVRRQHLVLQPPSWPKLVRGIIEKLRAGSQPEAVGKADLVEHAHQICAHGAPEGHPAPDLLEQARWAPALAEQSAGKDSIFSL